MNPAQHILIFAVRVYRCTLSPALGFLFGPGGCRFTPTCSGYALEAIQKHGALAGGWLATKRVCRCHPWGGCGHDPVPTTDFKSQISNLNSAEHGS
ncbi:MAG: membrane protein insertion efficiency factor YidD [Pedosphaera sp.]|nr:membrane protein insertion efficiency factor YidD [Pedosphaera sp.]